MALGDAISNMEKLLRLLRGGIGDRYFLLPDDASAQDTLVAVVVGLLPMRACALAGNLRLVLHGLHGIVVASELLVPHWHAVAVRLIRADAGELLGAEGARAAACTVAPLHVVVGRAALASEALPQRTQRRHADTDDTDGLLRGRPHDRLGGGICEEVKSAIYQRSPNTSARSGGTKGNTHVDNLRCC